MSIKNKFIMNNKKKPRIEEFLMKYFDKYGYSHADIKKTHMGIDIVIYANKPGLIIGRGGGNINEVSDKLKERFGFENARIDVQEVEKPYLNSKIVAEDIKSALERGLNFRRIGNIMLRKIMESGAVGAEIRLAGKLGSAKSRTQRFYDGYLKYSGETAKEYVDYAKTTAVTKAGVIGIKIRIMKEFPEAKIKEIKEVKEKKEPENLECPYCGKVYDKERSLKIHIGQKHAEESEKVDKKEDELQKKGADKKAGKPPKEEKGVDEKAGPEKVKEKVEKKGSKKEGKNEPIKPVEVRPEKEDGGKGPGKKSGKDNEAKG
ncbi:MAG: 30S ribosomal protein S3 [archaeon]|nr:MAG: 30S ribosomal protein S3 [archaeon]